MNSDHIVKFNHNYSKLHGQVSGFLCWADVFHMANLPMEAHMYDTAGKYGLIDGKDYIQLVFLGDKEIPFTTYRELNEKNKAKYFGHIGEVFEFEIEETKEN